MPRILCVGSDLPLLESRCAVLEVSGYDACVGAPPRSGEVVLRRQKFDLVVVSSLNDGDINLYGGAEVLVLDGFTMPSELIDLVAQRLNRQQRT